MSDRFEHSPRLAEVSEQIEVVEEAEPFPNLTTLNLGGTFQVEGSIIAYRLVDRTFPIRNYILRDVILHERTKLLWSHGRKLAETSYLVPDRAYEAAAIDDPVIVPEGAPVVIGCNRPWDGYYHWVVQCLPAIDACVQRAGKAGVRLALPALQGWHADLLDLLGYGGLERIVIEPDRSYALPCAIYNDHLRGQTADQVCRTAMHTFQSLRKNARARPGRHEIVYVARTDTGRRPLLNEAELIRFLQQEGVAIVVPSELSVAQQISVFSGAKIVIGPHGGGLTNIIFCPDDAALYELLPLGYQNLCFSRLAQTRGLDYWADLFPSEGDEHQQSWSVDLDYFRQRFAALRETIRQPARPPARMPTPPAVPNELFELYLGAGHTRPIDTWHHYFDIYERYLAHYRGVRATLLHIGMEQGGKLELWRNYLGPYCRLYGIDKDPEAARLAPLADRIFIGDPADPAFMRGVVQEIGVPDIVIQDGLYTFAQQIGAFEALYPAMADDGVYIAEDTYTSLWGGPFLDHPDQQSFLVHACACSAALMGWTGDTGNYLSLGTDFAWQLWSQVSELCRTTRAISFYDGIIAFERGPRTVPRHEQR